MFRLSRNGAPFEASISIPRLLIRAKYTSSGVLIIIPASGNGDFDATLGETPSTIKFHSAITFEQFFFIDSQTVLLLI